MRQSSCQGWRWPCTGIVFLTQLDSSRFTAATCSSLAPGQFSTSFHPLLFPPPEADKKQGKDDTFIWFLGPWKMTSLSSDDPSRSGMERKEDQATTHLGSLSREIGRQETKHGPLPRKRKRKHAPSEDSSTRGHDNTAEPPARHGGVSQGGVEAAGENTDPCQQEH